MPPDFFLPYQYSRNKDQFTRISAILSVSCPFRQSVRVWSPIWAAPGITPATLAEMASGARSHSKKIEIDIFAALYPVTQTVPTQDLVPFPGWESKDRHPDPSCKPSGLMLDGCLFVSLGKHSFG